MSGQFVWFESILVQLAIGWIVLSSLRREKGRGLSIISSVVSLPLALNQTNSPISLQAISEESKASSPVVLPQIENGFQSLRFKPLKRVPQCIFANILQMYYTDVLANGLCSIAGVIITLCVTQSVWWIWPQPIRERATQSHNQNGHLLAICISNLEVWQFFCWHWLENESVCFFVNWRIPLDWPPALPQKFSKIPNFKQALAISTLKFWGGH